jgi:hypothetical protein
LLVEKCEAVKPNGSKVPAERNDNHIVFTNLQPGDAIYVKYRVQNFYYGRMGREVWDKFIFNSFSPTLTARYCLITPDDLKFDSKVLNGDIKPIETPLHNYKLYTWEMKDMAPIKEEALMPSLGDVGISLHLSTLKSWADVANWYSDLSFQDFNKDDYELNAVYEEIFKKNNALSASAKARAIYDYIVTNIRYSSVSFRQSGFVPQSISKILSTKLGDCKDLSSLFVALAQKAGLTAQLVLIDTRNNGTKDMVLPSMDFNHCIALLKLDGKDRYIELTDSHLPFGSLPSNLQGALALIIPPQGVSAASAQLISLNTPNRVLDELKKQIDVNVAGQDLKINVVSVKKGALTTEWREVYADLSTEDKQKKWEETISGNYKNPVKVHSMQFSDLSKLTDSVKLDYAYTVKNEVVEAGSMKMIKIPFLDVVSSVDHFSSDSRQHPIEYWNYENTDIYESTILMHLQPGQKFIEVPGDQNFIFKNSNYKIRYTKEGSSLKIYRYAKVDRGDIRPEEYTNFKKFLIDIAAAEAKFIVFK